MNYLSVENISKSFGARTLFEGVSFGINKDQKIAFVAKNGTGKSTILSIINGLDFPDTGQVVIRKGIRMEFLSQEPNLQDELTVEESIFASDNEILKVIEQYEKALENIFPKPPPVVSIRKFVVCQTIEPFSVIICSPRFR